MITIQRPTASDVRRFLEQQSTAPFSYPEVGESNAPDPVPGYNNDHSRVLLGQGEAVYAAACEALRQWRMFPGDWAWVEPPGTPIQQGQVLVMVARVFGLHWCNGCRIAYTLDGSGPDRRFGFAYGTLPSHAEQGEERFSIEWLPDGSVWYDLKAFSQPRHWLVRCCKPVARALQRRFVRESLRKMQQETNPLLRK